MNRFAVPAVCVAGVMALLGCTEDQPTAAEPAAPVFSLEVSRLGAPVGDSVVVAIRSAMGSLGGLQGRVDFDPARLELVGQVPGRLTVINPAVAGHAAFVALDERGLPSRPIQLVFRIRAADYLTGLRSTVTFAAGTDVEPRRIGRAATTIQIAGDLDAVGATPILSAEAWARRLAPKQDIRAVPGQFVDGLRFGDPTLDGIINVFDVIYLANVAAGVYSPVGGSDAPGRDAVVAGNVRPANLPGLGEAGDALRPGVEPDGSMTINVFDALAVANEAAGIDQPVVGELIPGREAISPTRTVVAADVLVNTTWTADRTYELSGPIHVAGGATLTIQAGARIEGAGPASALIVTRDGRIDAQGTAYQPIVFTCLTGSTPCWGGVVIQGYAVLPTGLGPATSPAVRGTGAANCVETAGFGGCDPADDSGVLRYVRIEKAGLLLQAVGSATVIDFLQVDAAANAFQVTGGSVRLRHLLATATVATGLVWDNGWTGKLQFGLLTGGIVGSHGSAGTPVSAPAIYNVTTLFGSQNGIAFRAGTGGTLANVLLADGTTALDVSGAATCALLGSGGLALHHAMMAGFSIGGATDADPSPCGGYTSPNVETEWFGDPVNANQTLASSAGLMIGPNSATLPDYRPVAGSALASMPAATPPADGFFDPTARFVGGVAPAVLGTTSIPWYSGWSTPSAAKPVPPPPAVPSGLLGSRCGHDLTGIAFDGTYYYVGEGQFSLNQCVSRYTAAGAFVDSKTFTADIRGLHYVAATGKLVTRTWSGPLFQLDYQAGTTTQLTSFNPTPGSAGEQNQPAADPDGTTFWVLTGGRAERRRLTDNSVVSSFPVTGGQANAEALAVTVDRVYVPDGVQVQVYDKITGTPLGAVLLPSSSFTWSFGFGTSPTGDRVIYPGGQTSARVTSVPLGGTGGVPASARQTEWRFDVDRSAGTVSVLPPGTPGLGPIAGAPVIQRSILGSDVIQVQASNFTSTGVGTGGAPPGKVLVRFDIRIVNQITSIDLITPTFPTPPGSGIYLLPYTVNPITTVVVGGADVTVVLLNTGQVTPSNDWDVPDYSWIFSGACAGSDARYCFRSEAFNQPLGPGALSEVRTVGFLLDPSVINFRARLLLAADVRNAVP